MRTRLSILLWSAALLSCSGPKLRKPVAGDALTVAGKVEKGPFGLSSAEVAALRPGTVTGVEPRSGLRAAYSGPALAPLLSEGLARLPGTDLAIFYGGAGVRVAVPLNVVRQSRPVLASRVDGKPVDERLPGAGPLLVAWPDAEQPGLDTDPRMRWFWVRGVTRVDLAIWQEGYGRALRVPAGAPDEARHGSDAFAGQCIHCHKLRGQGGDAGPDLTGYLVRADEERLLGVLRDHLAARSGIPAVPELSPASARQVASFLRAVARAGGDRPSPGDDEIKEPPPYRPPPPPQRRP